MFSSQFFDSSNQRINTINDTINDGIEFTARTAFIPNDPLFVDQWHLSNTGQDISTGQPGGTPGAELMCCQCGLLG
ncbi:MAG: hypothetical protein F6K19_36905 [Cyanothece sp. SIO1E1]|nr:hypothetical protein [Cyanothece sp. SIO1E1]